MRARQFEIVLPNPNARQIPGVSKTKNNGVSVRQLNCLTETIMKPSKTINRKLSCWANKHEIKNKYMIFDDFKEIKHFAIKIKTL